MAQIPIPAVAPLWEHPSSEIRKLSTWKQQLDIMFHLTNCQRTPNRQLAEADKNNLMYAHLGSEAIRRFEYNPAMAMINDVTNEEFYKAIVATFDQPMPQAVAFYRLRSCKQQQGETATEFLSRLRTLQADCKYDNFNADLDLAYILAQNCYSPEVQKRLFSTPNVSLESYVNVMQAVENAEHSSATVRGDNRQVQAVFSREPRSKSPARHARRPSKERTPAVQCRGCGSTQHAYLSEQCKAKRQTCNSCNRKGHFSKVCERRKQSPQHHQRMQKSSVKAVHRLGIIKAAEPTQYRCSIRVVDDTDNDCFLEGIVDSGADVSLVPFPTFKRHLRTKLKPTSMELCNFDGSSITGLRGQFEATVEFNGRKAKLSLLVMDNIKTATWGTNVIEALGLLIDGTRRQISVVRPQSPTSISSARRSSGPINNESAAAAVVDDISSKPTNQLAVTKADPQIQSILNKFPTLTDDGIGRFPDFEHRIVVTENAVPVARNPRPIPIAYRKAVEAEIAQMVNDDVWERVDTPCAWALNLVTVPKSDRNVRITTDLAPLNQYVVPEKYPLPRINDLYLQLQGATIFSKLDIAKGYWHVVLAPESRPFTTTITPYGLFQYKRLPMGLTDAASVFQRLVSQTLAGCEGCISYLDDILVFGPTADIHNERLQNVLQRLSSKDFHLNVAKCRFAANEVRFLGHIIGNDGVRPDPASLDAIRNAPLPASVTDVRSFLGSINYLREFLPHLAEYAEPLQRLTRTSEQSTFTWTDECTAAFNKLKSMLTTDLQLAIFDPNRPTVLSTDASNIGLGACLSQVSKGRVVPVAFSSKTLSPRERAYATNEREALACVWACNHFANFLLGRRFTLVTDHKALVTILAQSGDGRKAHKFDRWRMQLSEFDYEIQHRPGSENLIPDMLSRLPQPDENITKKTIGNISTSGFSQKRIAAATANDDILQAVRQIVEQNAWSQKHRRDADLAPFYSVRHELYANEGCLYKSDRIVVPASLRQVLLKAAHAGHPGIARAKIKLRETYWWPGMSTDIEELVRHCTGCQDSGKSAPKVNVPTDPVDQPSDPWQRIGIDVSGPFATVPTNQRFMIVVVDHFSGFPEVKLANDHNVGTTIKFLEELFARYGNPDVIVSDNGPEYRSSAFKDFLAERDITHHRTPVYHPQANGKVEVFNRTLKFHAQALSNGHVDFKKGITELLARYRAERPSENKPSPAELMFQRRIRLPFEPRRTEAEQPAPHNRECHVTFNETADRPKQAVAVRAPLFKVGDKVRVKRPSSVIRKGETPYSDVMEVTKVISEYVFKLSDGNIWNARRMRRYYPPALTLVPIADADQTEPGQVRHATRTNFGLPPRRYSPRQ